MADQFDLPGFGAPSTRAARREPPGPTRPAGPHNLFFALVPVAEALPSIVDLRSRLRASERLTGKPIDADRLHITLLDLGGYDEPPTGVIERAARAAAAVCVPPVALMFDRALSFPGKQRRLPFVLRCSGDLAELAAFRGTLGRAIADAGLWRGETRTPHVTLLYDDRQVAEREVEPIRWIAREFVLVFSWGGRMGNQVLARWPLAG